MVGVAVERVSYGEIEAVLPPAPFTSVSVHLAGSCTVDWAPDGRTITTRPARGGLTVVPRGREGLLRVRDGTCTVLKLGVPDTALVDPCGDGARARPLQDRFGVADPLVFELGRALLEESERAPTVDRVYRDALTAALVTHLVRCHGEGRIRPRGDERPVRPFSPRRAQQVVAFLHDHLTADIGLDDVARALNLSTSHFAAQFRRSFGTTPARYLTSLRLERARLLLEAGRLPVAAVARRAGFRSASHFSQAFRAEFGETPTRWRATRA